jgi:hypothetical protein
VLHGKVRRNVFGGLRSAQCVGSSGTGEWRRLHNKELSKHYWDDQMKKNVKDGAFDTYGG